MDSLGGAASSQADEAKKKMDEALKNLTPEQRQLMEKMMKERKTGDQ